MIAGVVDMIICMASENAFMSVIAISVCHNP